MLNRLSIFGLTITSLVAACAALGPAKSAETQSKALSSIQVDQETTIVAKNDPTDLWYFYNLYPDCSSAGKMSLRIISPPAHGRIEAVEIETYPNYASDNVRSHCNAMKAPALVLKYTPATDFTGDDHADVVVIYAGGSATRSQFTIGVM